MESIGRLQDQVQKAGELLARDEAALKTEPQNFALRISAESMRKHVEDIQSQLRHALELREKEVIEVHLEGIHAKHGSIPLMVLGRIAQSMAEAISATSQKVKLGLDPPGRVRKDIVNLLNLQLSGIATGSTRLFITGDTAPDLFGQSVLTESLERTFELLESDNGEELTQSISRVGIRSGKKLAGFLKVLGDEEFDVELKWSSPVEKVHSWKADQQRMRTITTSLDSISELPPETLSVEGTLYMMSLKGAFEIHGKDGSNYKGQFPLELLREIKPLHLGDNISASLSKRIIQNKAAGTTKAFYSLLSVVGI